MSSLASRPIDIRGIAPAERHPLIFNRFAALQAGEAMELVNDHDPVPLRLQFEDRVPGRFEWTYLESGPALWRVRIGSVSPAHAAAREDSCCSGGACCG
jgi:uncharacterized protein (DUF2249 family)